MVALTKREQIINTVLNSLSDEQVDDLLNYLRDLAPLTHYREENDPSIGFISGPTDLAEKAEDILWAEFGVNKSQSDET
jgi:phage/plasmid-associated DNA primase